MFQLLDQMTSSLRVLKNLLDKAHAYIEEHGRQEADLLDARLAEDMFPLTRQIQMSADTLKFSAARLSGKLDEAPRFEDDETTIAELKARLDRTIAYLESFEASDFEGYETRVVLLPFAKGFYLDGIDYLHQFAIPNFYFHVVTAYDILRHEGVSVGKRDYLGHVNMKPLEEGAQA
jgi:hypothetical protein